MTPKVLVLTGANRPGSPSKRLAFAAAGMLAQMQAEVTVISLADYPLPLYDGETVRDRAPPDEAVKLARLFTAHDALFLASPEYNASAPPLLTNALAWIATVTHDGDTRIRPFEGLTVALGTASETVPGVRGLDQLRAVLMHLGAQIVTEQCEVGRAATAFGDDERLARQGDIDALASTLGSLMERCTPGRAR